jgi:hypothetical protein
VNELGKCEDYSIAPWKTTVVGEDGEEKEVTYEVKCK